MGAKREKTILIILGSLFVLSIGACIMSGLIRLFMSLNAPSSSYVMPPAESQSQPEPVPPAASSYQATPAPYQPVPAPAQPENPVLSPPRFVREGCMSYVTMDLKWPGSEKANCVMVSFSLYDVSGRRVGATFDTITDWEPGEVWHVKAPVFDDSVHRAKWTDVSGY